MKTICGEDLSLLKFLDYTCSKNIPPEVFPKIRKFRKNTSVMEQRFKKLARKPNTAEQLLLLSYHCVAYFPLDQVFT